MASQNDLLVHKVATILSWVLAVYATFRYFVGRSPFDKHNPYHVGDTPYSSNLVFTLLYWAVLFLSQIAFVTQIFLPAADSSSVTNRNALTKLVGWHFTIFNLGVFVWTLLFVKHHYFWSEVILVLNFVNILSLYFTHKTYAITPLSNWFLIHWPTAALPFSWLFYAIFWNGAVLFHVHKFVGRVIANITIWMFLFVPGFFLAVFNDWAVGLSSSALMFSLGVGQVITKAFALQWIFAFVIASVLLVLSLIVAVTGSLTKKSTDTESAPLLQN
ncbi:hypothetical protein EJF18_80047 [Clavispora lusitaniae]|uniref:DUF1774-domain-containing protein n=3 Tax=Clavispora lusitaniae TaxID=36911 RepID=C4YC76_CLAL4|nr:uncharacterized protein CLUG_05893 [Clavispora lusitaniae ATCC 42720]KAF5208719.1 hypothetical protein E0198_005227 [Clavispora lusitaniae]EEQ41765.1 hypothetical protein CLUG_05893 [Clavispora lusitaniae ATCC 42720]KAF7580460.1 hypothetical protein FOB63_004398 [Clavispora lusitaniae]OVF09270.1 hypothetical protein A9F13_05g00561 [Clavispora lusitaniae]QFZ30332.1 hypothetical protein EJF14_80047 [Clavispora lusitaniae]